MSSLEAAPVKEERAADILSDDALDFLSELHARFNPRRLELLQARKEREAPSGFREETKEIREAEWKIAAFHFNLSPLLAWDYADAIRKIVEEDQEKKQETEQEREQRLGQPHAVFEIERHPAVQHQLRVVADRRHVLGQAAPDP